MPPTAMDVAREKWPREDGFDPSSSGSVDSGYWLHEVPFDPTIVMVLLICKESGRVVKHAFRDKLSKL